MYVIFIIVDESRSERECVCGFEEEGDNVGRVVRWKRRRTWDQSCGVVGDENANDNDGESGE